MPERRAFLGLLVLDTRFPRLAGDGGRADSYGMLVQPRVVQGATPKRVVLQADEALLAPFIRAAVALQAEGAAAISTSCGFLWRWQAQIQAALRVPFWSSSLLKLAELPPAPLTGVLTVDERSLQPLLPGQAIAGLAEHSHLRRVLLGNETELDEAQAREDAVQAARQLLQAQPPTQHLVLECTNLAPHAQAIAAATGCTVHHLVTLVHERWNALKP
jgi:hypothetical protein